MGRLEGQHTALARTHTHVNTEPRARTRAHLDTQMRQNTPTHAARATAWGERAERSADLEGWAGSSLPRLPLRLTAAGRTVLRWAHRRIGLRLFSPAVVGGLQRAVLNAWESLIVLSSVRPTPPRPSPGLAPDAPRPSPGRARFDAHVVR